MNAKANTPNPPAAQAPADKTADKTADKGASKGAADSVDEAAAEKAARDVKVIQAVVDDALGKAVTTLFAGPIPDAIAQAVEKAFAAFAGQLPLLGAGQAAEATFEPATGQVVDQLVDRVAEAVFPTHHFRNARRTITVRDGGAERERDVPLHRHEIVSFKDYGDHAVFVTTAGQKISAAA